MKSNPSKQDSPDVGSDLTRGFEKLYFSDGQHFSIPLLVPAHLRKAWEAEELAKEELTRLRAEQEVAERDAGRSSSQTESALFKKGDSLAKPAEASSKQKAIWSTHARKRPRGVGHYPVFDPAQALALHGRIGRYHKEDRQRFERIYDHLSASGHLRTVAKPSEEALQHLAATQPHMAEVVDFVLDQVGLARHARKPLRLVPILLVGEAGIGKTHFAQCLAKALSAPVSIQRLDSDLSGALMLGSDRKWSSSQHGLLFELLALGSTANPVVLLDEIDKINRTEHNVQSTLYSVLEPVSAKHLRDISLEFELDAGLVTWIGTANDATRLDEPLRSRFKEFHIQVPTAEQCLVLAREVVSATIAEVGVRGFSQLTNRLECDLAHLPARQIQQITRQAMARAVSAGRMSLQRQDLPGGVLGVDRSDGAADAYLH